MSESSRPPKLDGCRVAVFQPSAVSGATLGYYGTVIGRWQHGIYFVHIPALDQVVRVHSCDMLLLQQSEEGNRLVTTDDPEAWHLAERRWEIEFESPPEADNAAL